MMQTRSVGWTLALLLPFAALLLGGCTGLGKKTPQYSVSIHVQTSETLPTTQIRPVEITRPKMLVFVKALSDLTDGDLDHAERDDSPGGPYVRLVFDPHGTMVLRWLTTEYRNRYLVVFLNSRPVMAYYVDHTIPDGRLTLIGDIPQEEVDKVVEALQPKNLEKRRSR